MAALTRASMWAALLYAMSDIQLAAVHILDRNTCQINIEQASNIHSPLIGRRSRSAKRQNAAYGAKVVLRDLRVPLIHAQIADRGKKPQRIAIHPMNERAPAATNRAVANAYMIEISVNFEAYFAAVTTTAVRLSHGV